MSDLLVQPNGMWDLEPVLEVWSTRTCVQRGSILGRVTYAGEEDSG
jgi:hypothetical protein